MKKFLLRNYEWEQGIKEATRDLLAGKHRHDVLENSIRAIEMDESADTVGFGGYPNLIGKMELDGAFMNGDDRSIGAVAGVSCYLPVRIARHLMEENMHVLLAGEGAELFARGCGLQEETTLSPTQKERWQRDIKPRLDKTPPEAYMNLVRELSGLSDVKDRTWSSKKEFDTVVMIAGDGNGLSVAASTSGWPYKFPGRVGDSPVAGAGFYVDSAYGGCLCTHTGEMSIRAGMARQVVGGMEQGKSVKEAVDLAVGNLARLKTGVMNGLCIYAVDREANASVVAVDIDDDVPYQYWREGMERPERRVAETRKLKL